jgi:hypothetical protein
VTRRTLIPEEVKYLEENPAAIDEYAEGFQTGRLHSLARLADCNVWAGLAMRHGAYSQGYRDGWKVEGRMT